MKKIVITLMLGVSFMLATINLQTASKTELMSIKGIGPVKADQIIEYRKTNKIKNPSDLQNIKGFGPSIISNITKTKTTTNEKVVKKKVDTKIEAKKDLKIQEIQNKTK